MVDWVGTQLRDYHMQGGQMGGPQVLAPLVDVMVYSMQCRGDSPAAITDALVDAIFSSVNKGEGCRCGTALIACVTAYAELTFA